MKRDIQLRYSSYAGQTVALNRTSDTSNPLRKLNDISECLSQSQGIMPPHARSKSDLYP
jgi:hypothetical protein